MFSYFFRAWEEIGPSIRSDNYVAVHLLESFCFKFKYSWYKICSLCSFQYTLSDLTFYTLLCNHPLILVIMFSLHTLDCTIVGMHIPEYCLGGI